MTFKEDEVPAGEDEDTKTVSLGKYSRIKQERDDLKAQLSNIKQKSRSSKALKDVDGLSVEVERIQSEAKAAQEKRNKKTQAN